MLKSNEYQDIKESVHNIWQFAEWFRLASAYPQSARPQQAFETSRKGAPRSTDDILRANGATELRNTRKCSGSCPIASKVLETAWPIIWGMVGSSLLPSTGISSCTSGTRCWSFAAAHKLLATAWEPMSITKSSDWIKWSIRTGLNFRSFGAAFLSTGGPNYVCYSLCIHVLYDLGCLLC